MQIPALEDVQRAVGERYEILTIAGAGGMGAVFRARHVALVLRVVREIGGALDFAHGRGVVHRDVKPSNILIEEGAGRALLTDFGVARIERVADSSLTAPGTPLGTPDYMAPEQAAGSERVDGRADLYSLALVAFEALT